MNTIERTGCILSFLGKPDNDRYRHTEYVFPALSGTGQKSYEGGYASSVYFMHLTKSKIKISKCIICGTVSSIWDTLSEEYLNVVEKYVSKLNIKNKIIKSLNSPDFAEINGQIRELRASAGTHDETLPQLKGLLYQLQELFNQAFWPYETKFEFVIHHDRFQTYAQQNSLLEDLINNSLFDKNSDIYLDLTYGLRTMPFFAYTGLHCLRNTANLNIREIVYFKEQFRTSPKQRLERLENIKSKLRYLSLTDPKKFNEISGRIRALTERKQDSAQENTPESTCIPPSKSYVCSLNLTEKYMRYADIITKFKYSGDIGEFSELIKENNLDAYDCMLLISEYLNLCNYDKAAEVISECKSDIMQELTGIRYVKALTSDLFSCFDGFAENKSDFLKKLTSFYLKYNNYPHALNACDSALNNFEKNNINFQIFKYGLRSAMIHLNEQTYGSYTEKEEIKKFLNNLDKKNIKSQISDLFKSLGIPVDGTTDIRERKKILFTFLGSGDYSCTDYTYCSDDSDSSPFFTDVLKDSKVLGLSIAKSLLKNNSLDRLVIVGTNSSNWPVVLESVRESMLSGISAETLQPYLNLKEDIDANFYVTNNRSITEEQIRSLNNFFKNNKEHTGTEIMLLTFDSQIDKAESQQNLIDKMISCTNQNSEVYFDITHSFRIIPIISIALIVYLQANKNIILKDLFYGTVERENDFHKEKADETVTRSKLFRKIDGLKNTNVFDDSRFQKIMADIEAECQNISKGMNLNGEFFSMKNIVNNLNYANAISAYDKTGNLQTLETIINAQIRLTDDIINKFSVGAFYDSIINTEKAQEYLKVFYEAMKKPRVDTILSSLTTELMNQLKWIDHSEQGLRKLALCKSRMETAISNKDYFQALLNGYEGFKFIALSISGQLKNYINSNNGSEGSSFERKCATLVNHLKARQSDNFQKMDKYIKYKEKRKSEKAKYLSFLDPQQEFNHKENNYVENEILIKLSTQWNRLKNNRNNCTHPDRMDTIKNILTNLKETMAFFEEIIKKHEKNNSDTITLDLFTLI